MVTHRFTLATALTKVAQVGPSVYKPLKAASASSLGVCWPLRRELHHNNVVTISHSQMYCIFNKLNI